MATILFYESNRNIQQQLSPYFAKTDHAVEFIEEPLDSSNSNPKAEVISIFASNKITEALLSTMPNLKLIATRSTGFDHIDLAVAAAHGVTVTNVPQYGVATVAEYTFAVLLSLSRRLPATATAMQAGEPDVELLRGFDLQGKTFGVIGTGRIGLHAVTIANGFGMHVIAYDLYPNEAKATELGFEYVSLDELAAQSDVISLHAPGTPETHHIINEAFLAQAKPTAVLVNTARGELVDTDALKQALEAKKLAGAGLDVLEFERLMHSDSAGLTETEAAKLRTIQDLQKMPNVIVTPHNAFNTHEAVARIQQTTAQNIIDFFEGKTPNKV